MHLMCSSLVGRLLRRAARHWLEDGILGLDHSALDECFATNVMLEDLFASLLAQL